MATHIHIRARARHFTHDADTKANKASVDYSKGHPRSYCKECRYFSDGSCEKVSGSIDPLYWCKLFTKKVSQDGIFSEIAELLETLWHWHVAKEERQ